MVDAYFSERRNRAAAEAFFQRGTDETGSTPMRVTPNKAACYPPALREALATAEHRRSQYLNNGLERDDQRLKQRHYPMRRFKQASSAGILGRGYAFIQNLRNGFSTLTASVPRPLRIMCAWLRLAQMI